MRGKVIILCALKSKTFVKTFGVGVKYLDKSFK